MTRPVDALPSDLYEHASSIYTTKSYWDRKLPSSEPSRDQSYLLWQTAKRLKSWFGTAFISNDTVQHFGREYLVTTCLYSSQKRSANHTLFCESLFEFSVPCQSLENPIIDHSDGYGEMQLVQVHGSIGDSSHAIWAVAVCVWTPQIRAFTSFRSSRIIIFTWSDSLPMFLRTFRPRWC